MGTTSGLALVGELGPELVNFRSPVQVIPNSALMGGEIGALSGVGGSSALASRLDRIATILTTILPQQTGAAVGSVIGVHSVNMVNSMATELASARLR
jgi:hypothetical protein